MATYYSKYNGIDIHFMFSAINHQIKKPKPNHVIIGKVYFMPFIRIHLQGKRISKENLRLCITKLPNGMYDIDVNLFRDYYRYV